MDSARVFAFIQPVPPSIRIAQVVGVTSAGFLAGYTTSISIACLPALQHASPEARMKGWRSVYAVGANIAPFVTAAGSLAYGYLAIDAFGVYVPFALYTASTISLVSTVPYTHVLMKSINSALRVKASASSPSVPSTLDVAEKGIGNDGETRELLDRWSQFNLGRAMLQGLSTLLGLWAVVIRPSSVTLIEQVAVPGGLVA